VSGDSVMVWSSNAGSSLPTRMCSLCAVRPAEVTHNCTGLLSTSTSAPALTDVPPRHGYWRNERG